MVFSYHELDFALGDDLEIVEVQTIVEKDIAETETELKNTLITFWENSKINYDHKSNIYYKRMNHLQFKYQIGIQNPKQLDKKVFIRIWLGLLKDEKDIKLYRVSLYALLFILSCSSYDPKYMLEMDQFVQQLSGKETETIERHSTESSATMKHQDTTLRRYILDYLFYNGLYDFQINGRYQIKKKYRDLVWYSTQPSDPKVYKKKSSLTIMVRSVS